jgi:small conductance mechanosensitive channel
LSQFFPEFLPDFETSELLINTGQVLVVVFLFAALHWVLRKSLKSLGERRKYDYRVIRQLNLFEKYIIITLGLLTILGILGVDLTVIATSLGVAGIAVGFAARDILSNFLSGIFLLVDKVYVVNDVVDIGGTYGIVRIITLRNTQIKTFDGNIVTVPNSQVASSKVVNMTSGASKMLASTSVNVGYDEDSDRVNRILEESAKEVEGVIIDEGNPVIFQQEELGNDTLGYRLTAYYKVEAHREPWITSNVYNHAVKKMIENKIKFQKQAPRESLF